MGLFNFLKKTEPKKAAPAPRPAKHTADGFFADDCYEYRGSVEDYFAELLEHHFPSYEVRRMVPVEKLAVAAAPAGGWTCACGQVNDDAFCTECGAKKPTAKPVSREWICDCGKVNEGKFCPACGTPRPAMTYAAPAPAAPAAVAVEKPAKGSYETLSFALYLKGQVQLAIILCPKSKFDTRNINNTLEYCKKHGIPCQRYFKEFRNEASYVRDRVAAALR